MKLNLLKLLLFVCILYFIGESLIFKSLYIYIYVILAIRTIFYHCNDFLCLFPEFLVIFLLEKLTALSVVVISKLFAFLRNYNFIRDNNLLPENKEKKLSY